MELKDIQYVDNPSNIDLNKPSKGKFLFYLFFLGFFVYISGCSYALFNNKYKSTEGIEVPESAQYNPKYK